MIGVEHRDRLEYVEAALATHGRRVVDAAEIADDREAGPARRDCFPVRQTLRQKGREEPRKKPSRPLRAGMRSHRIALVPTVAQEVFLRRAVGVSRFAYNGALAEWKRQYQAGEKPSEVALRRQLSTRRFSRH